MSTFGAKKGDLVSNADKFYFGNATVRGLRKQLRENKLPVGGLKYEMYRRLVDNGFRLYNDDRSDDIVDDEDEEDNVDPDDNKVDLFKMEDEETDDSEDEYLEDDDIETDPSESEPEYDDEEDDSEEDEDDRYDPGQDDQDQDDQNQDDPSEDYPSQDDQDQDDQDQYDEDQYDEDQDEQKQDDQGSSGKKRRRDDGGDSDGDDNAPAHRRRRIGAALPLELQAVIIENLNAPGVWNLINTAPEEYLRGDLNVLILEARHQYRLDYPPPPPAPVVPGGFRKTVPGPWPDPGLDRAVSLLEWVARRVLLDSNFRTANRTRIMRVIDAYLAVYGMADPAPLPINALPNPREDLLYYFRDRNDLLAGNLTPLMHASRNQFAAAVALLLMRGADVNQAINGVTALELASAAGFNTVQPWAYNTMQTAYALIGAGADVTVLGTNSRTQASVALGYLMINIPPYNSPPQPGQEVPEDFPRIDNSLGLSVRQFVLDERSDHQDKMILTLFVVMYRTMVYPRYI